MRCKTFPAIVALSLAPAMYALAQNAEGDLSALIADTFERLRQGRPAKAISDEVFAARPQEALQLLRPYEQSASARVRHRAYMLDWRIGRLCAEVAVRQEVTDRLVTACSDTEPLVWQHASKYLLSFERKDFSPASKEAIRKLLMNEKPAPQVVRLVGVAGLRDALPRLRALLIDETTFETRRSSGRWYGTTGWAARLVRARLGVQVDMQRAIQLVEREPDDVVRVTVLLRDLAFTRQAAALEFIDTYLNNEETLPQLKVTGPGTAYAQYALDVLAETVPGFPVKKQSAGGYSRAEITQAREWMKNRSKQTKP